MARWLFHELNTAPIAPQSCCCTSCGKSLPVFSRTMPLYVSTSPRSPSAGISASVFTPDLSRSAKSSCSKRSLSISSTTPEYIWMKRRYESSAKRSSFDDFASPCTVSSFRPRLRIVSIMPGIEARAPERTETSSGCSRSPKLRPTDFSTRAEVLGDRGLQFGRIRFVVVVKVRADGGGDREAGRHRNADVGHLGQARAFAAEDVLHLRVALGVHRRRSSRRIAAAAWPRDYLRTSTSTLL